MTRVINAVIKYGTAVPVKSNSVDLCEGESVQIVVCRKNGRKVYMVGFGIVGGLFVATASLIAGVLDRFEVWPVNDTCALIIVGFWVLVPPVFLWFDWVYFCPTIDDKDLRDEAKHTHDLARNIWLALSVVLIALFKITSIINL